mmetsp:Transcript_118068/g.165973  ORF Transcript_118068/g.165973 Transcript_118068/m.165973 type:complete len:87 (-) Transcript_118068:297-557(-)
MQLGIAAEYKPQELDPVSDSRSSLALEASNWVSLKDRSKQRASTEATSTNLSEAGLNKICRFNEFTGEFQQPKTRPDSADGQRSVT